LTDNKQNWVALSGSPAIFLTLSESNSVMPLIKRANTIVYCRRWKETVTFYRDHLGLGIAFQNDWLVEFGLTPTAFLSIAEQSRTTISSAEGKGITLSFQIDDIKAEHVQLIQKGLSPTDIRSNVMGADVFYLRDPEKNRIEFWSPCH
jgi:catechol 2,3-dioxygenase-like lactoylglutathione lyase family enzyme